MRSKNFRSYVAIALPVLLSSLALSACGGGGHKGNPYHGPVSHVIHDDGGSTSGDSGDSGDSGGSGDTGGDTGGSSGDWDTGGGSSSDSGGSSGDSGSGTGSGSDDWGSGDDGGWAGSSVGKNRGRDRSRVQAQDEKRVAKAAVDRLVKNHPALSETGAERIVRNLQAWESLTTGARGKKGLTEKDVADFSMRIFGVSYDKTRPAVEAAMKGDTSALLSLKDEVGNYWGDTSQNREETQSILKSWYAGQVRTFEKKYGKQQ